MLSFIVSYLLCPQKQDQLLVKAKQEKQVYHMPLCISIYMFGHLLILSYEMTIHTNTR